jgi:hypothetical protein
LSAIGLGETGNAHAVRKPTIGTEPSFLPEWRMPLPALITCTSAATFEAQLDVKLLLRTTRRVAPTDAGRVFLERARQILGDLDDAENAARRVDSLRCNLPIELLGPFRGLCLCLAKLRFPTAETGAGGDRLECRVNGRESRAHLALLRPLSRQVGETGNAPTRITSTTPASRLM